MDLGRSHSSPSKTIDGHAKKRTGDPWMVVDQEVGPRRDGGMKSMTSGDVLRGSRMPKTNFHGKGMLRPKSNKRIDNGLI